MPSSALKKSTGRQKEIETIKDAITHSLRNGVRDVLQEIYRNGGYYKLSGVKTVKYDFYDVPIWYDCDYVYYPNVEDEIKKGLKEYIENNFKSTMEFFGKKVMFNLNQVGIDTFLSDKKLDVTVRMKTKIEGGQEVDEYTLSLPTRIKKVIEFARDFTTEVNKTRFFEATFLGLLFRINKPEVYVLLNRCGETFIKTRDEMLSDMKWFLKRFPSHIVFGRNVLAAGDEPMYNIFMVNNKVYPEFKVSFDYPSSWDLDSNFYANPSPAIFTALPSVPLVPVCVMRGSIEYTLRFPIVTRVEDEKEGKLFMFASMVNILDNYAFACKGNLMEGKGVEAKEYEEICMKNLDCHANITVIDSEGNPVEGVNVMYYICSLGRTDANGRLSVAIPCIDSVLRLMKEGYVEYGEFYSHDELENITIEIKKGNKIALHFYRVPIQGSGSWSNGRYASYSVTNEPVEIDNSYFVTLTFVPEYPDFGYSNVVPVILFNQNDEGAISSSANTSLLYPVTYNVSGNLVNNQTQFVTGYFNEEVSINEGVTDLYVYLPDVINAQGNINATETNKLFNLVKNKCGGVVKEDEC